MGTMSIRQAAPIRRRVPTPDLSARTRGVGHAADRAAEGIDALTRPHADGTLNTIANWAGLASSVNDASGVAMAAAGVDSDLLGLALTQLIGELAATIAAPLIEVFVSGALLVLTMNAARADVERGYRGAGARFAVAVLSEAWAHYLRTTRHRCRRATSPRASAPRP